MNGVTGKKFYCKGFIFGVINKILFDSNNHHEKFDGRKGRGI
jgi:hypothetical protein